MYVIHRLHNLWAVLTKADAPAPHADARQGELPTDEDRTEAGAYRIAELVCTRCADSCQYYRPWDLRDLEEDRKYTTQSALSQAIANQSLLYTEIDDQIKSTQKQIDEELERFNERAGRASTTSGAEHRKPHNDSH